MNYELNKLITDEFGRVNGILAINKPVGITSHDVVARVRKKLNTRHVGHAGALDPFASGIVLILVGKATKLSDSYLGQDKEYVANVLFGIRTDSADTEGKVLEVKQVDKLPENLTQVLESFKPEYQQFVPVFSSIKVNGDKLRVLARKSDSFEVETRGDKRVAIFHRDLALTEVELPAHLVKIYEIEQISDQVIDITDTEFAAQNSESLANLHEFPGTLIRVSCSKGTYVRTLAEDIGQRCDPPLPAMLFGLERTKIGEITLEEALDLEDLDRFSQTATSADSD